MRILVLDVPREGVTPADYAPHLLNEIKHGWALIKSDIIREIYMRQDHPGVVVIVEAESVEQAKEICDDFPLVKASKGCVINITSGLVNNPMPMNSIYTASKAAVLSLTQTWAKELAPYGIRVNSVAAGATKTPLYDGLGLNAEETKSYEDAVANIVPLGRFAEPDEIAPIVTFLASDKAIYATGGHYAVDGGFGI